MQVLHSQRKSQRVRWFRRSANEEKLSCLEEARSTALEMAQEEDETAQESAENAPEVGHPLGVWGSGILAGSSYALKKV